VEQLTPMKCYCVHCLKPFAGRNLKQEFCSPKCRAAFGRALKVEQECRREAIRNFNPNHDGMEPCVGGWHAIDFGLSDGSDRT
jgi:hypothetical protein